MYIHAYKIHVISFLEMDASKSASKDTELMQDIAARKLLCALSHQAFLHCSFFQGASSVGVSDSIVALSHNTIFCILLEK